MPLADELNATIAHLRGVAWAFLDADFTRRAEPADILAALRALPTH